MVFSSRIRGAFTLVELLVVIAIIGVLVGLLLPAVQAAREAARKMQCGNNLKQLGLALQTYESTHGMLPMASGGTGFHPEPAAANNFRLSGLVALLPFLEQQPLWQEISKGWGGFNPMGPTPYNNPANYGGSGPYDPFRQQVNLLRCPSDPVRLAGMGQTNYAFCYGDGTRYVGHAPYSGPEDFGVAGPVPADQWSKRGAFARRHNYLFRDITDGASNTIAMGEIGVGDGKRRLVGLTFRGDADFHVTPALCKQTINPNRPTQYGPGTLVPRGRRWADGHIEQTGFTTVLPPNSPSCQQPGDATYGEVSGVFSAGSYHAGGCQVLYCDGSVRFVSETIDSGNISSPSVANVGSPFLPRGSRSPYGVWGAAGTRDGEESITIE